MDIYVGIHGFLEIHVWICYGFSDQGYKNIPHHQATVEVTQHQVSRQIRRKNIARGHKRCKP